VDVSTQSSAVPRGHAAIQALPAEELLPLVYNELRTLAAHKLLTERPGTLQPTALVHEAWIRLMGSENPPRYENDGHFFSAAAEAMRRILIERARQRNSLKRGGGALPLDVTEMEIPAIAEDDDTLLAVNQALEAFATHDPEVARFITLRFFVGLTNSQAALALGIPERTARRHWSFARAWLYRELKRERG